MNRAIIRRLINEYLDGEIGLADKAELERIMAENPEVRQEYRELRRISLHLSSLPEISVHPSRFRARVLSALDNKERMYFTPQRAFAGAMLVAFMVVGLMFGLMLYQDHMLGDKVIMATVETGDLLTGDLGYNLSLQIATTPEAFFNRLLLESELGMVSQATLQPFVTQTQLFEGARCIDGGGMNSVAFPNPLPHTLRIKMTLRQVLTLSQTAEGLTGQESRIVARGSDGSTLSFREFIRLSGDEALVILTLNFK